MRSWIIEIPIARSLLDGSCKEGSMIWLDMAGQGVICRRLTSSGLHLFFSEKRFFASLLTISRGVASGRICSRSKGNR